MFHSNKQQSETHAIFSLQRVFYILMDWKLHYQYGSRSTAMHVHQESSYTKLRRQEFCNSFTSPLQLRVQISNGSYTGIRDPVSHL